MNKLEIRQLTGCFGAEILGVDVGNLSDGEFDAVRNAFHEHGVIFFRDQKLSPEKHISFAERWGEININRFFQAVDGYPMIAEVRKEGEQTVNVGGSWHTDHSYDEIPALGSILLARDLPATGGDTLYASMGAAYDALSESFKEMLNGLRAVHSSRHVFGARVGTESRTGGRIKNADLATQDSIHPVVIRHPETGRKLLYVNPGFTIGIEGWNPAESNSLLKFLYRHAMKPEFTLRFSWREGSIAFWDNRATWHYALNDYHGQRRLMHRVTIEGVPLAS
jgi:taurine dioxygenase